MSIKINIFGTFGIILFLFVYTPTPTLIMAFAGVTIAHGPQPKQTTYRPPTGSKTTATGSTFISTFDLLIGVLLN